jgi:site-specific DNA-methyltransferase (adenine-specific)
MRLILGDCAQIMAQLHCRGVKVDALVCDPPAGIGFMGKSFDSDRGGRDAWILWLQQIMEIAIQLVKPGGHGLVWALPRTSHWTATALENAGWEIRDIVCHIFGSGFPKSLDVSKAIDGAAGAEREVVGAGPYQMRRPRPTANTNTPGAEYHFGRGDTITAPATPDAQRWQGWGTALKPAAEHWILVRKPLAGTVAASVLAHGTGGINVEGCRVEGAPRSTHKSGNMSATSIYNQGTTYDELAKHDRRDTPAGRWPPHLLLSHAADCGDRCAEGCPVRVMDEQSGELQSGARRAGMYDGTASSVSIGRFGRFQSANIDASAGGASRFFPRFRYQPKPSRAEREAGCEHLPGKTAAEVTEREDGAAGQQHARSGKTMTGTIRNHHPTLKSIDLMRWLCRLITPPGGIVLDPFMGSGTTGCACVVEGFDFIGIEQDPEYVQIARRTKGAAIAMVMICASGQPIPVCKAKTGDRIKVLIEQAPCTVLHPLQRNEHGPATYICVQYSDLEIADIYLGADHTVWLLSRDP